MDRKQTILDEIELMKRDKPKGWKKRCLTLIAGLRKLEDPYGEHEDRGSDERGRPQRPHNSAPLRDKYD